MGVNDFASFFEQHEMLQVCLVCEPFDQSRYEGLQKKEENEEETEEEEEDHHVTGANSFKEPCSPVQSLVGRPIRVRAHHHHNQQHHNQQHQHLNHQVHPQQRQSVKTVLGEVTWESREGQGILDASSAAHTGVSKEWLAGKEAADCRADEGAGGLSFPLNGTRELSLPFEYSRFASTSVGMDSDGDGYLTYNPSTMLERRISVSRTVQMNQDYHMSTAQVRLAS